jgi:hypothetical protein
MWRLLNYWGDEDVLVFFYYDKYPLFLLKKYELDIAVEVVQP